MREQNVGGIDRKMRLLLGAALVGFGAGRLSGRKVGRRAGAGALGAGLYGLVTGFSQYCPLSEALGLDSRPEVSGKTLLSYLPSTRSRVPRNTAPHVNQQVTDLIRCRVDRLKKKGAEAIRQRLEELDAEWDVERAIETQAGLAILLGVGLSATVHPVFTLNPVAVGSMVALHAVQGWYPLLPLFRRLGFRTTDEIYAERNMLKAARGDFDDKGRSWNVQRLLEAVEAV